MFQRELMDRLSAVLDEVTNAIKAGTVTSEIRRVVMKAMLKRGNEGSLNEFVSWFDYECDESDEEITAQMRKKQPSNHQLNGFFNPLKKIVKLRTELKRKHDPEKLFKLYREIDSISEELE